MKPWNLIARKEAGELLLSVRGILWLLTAAVGMSVFALLLVSNTELSLLDNAQVVYDMLGIVTAMGSLLALIVGVDTLGGERERKTIVPLLLAPVSRQSILNGKLSSIATAWAAMFLIALPYVWAVASTGQNLFSGIAVLALLGTPVVLSFGYFGMWLGTRTRQSVTAYMIGLVTLVVCASPLLLGPALRQSAIGRAFDLVNPFSGAVNAYDAVVIDSMSIISQWVGFLTVGVWLIVMIFGARRSFAGLTS